MHTTRLSSRSMLENSYRKEGALCDRKWNTERQRWRLRRMVSLSLSPGCGGGVVNQTLSRPQEGCPTRKMAVPPTSCLPRPQDGYPSHKLPATPTNCLSRQRDGCPTNR